MTEVALRREVEELRRDNEMMRAQLDAIRTKLAPIKQQHKAQIDALTTRITALNLEVERLRGEAASSSGGGGGGGGGAEQTAELTRLRDEVARLRAYKKRQDEKRATKGEHKTFFSLVWIPTFACARSKSLPPPPPPLPAVLLPS